MVTVHYCEMKSEKICWNQFLPHLSLTRKSFIKFLKNLFWLLLRFTQFFLCKWLKLTNKGLWLNDVVASKSFFLMLLKCWFSLQSKNRFWDGFPIVFLGYLFSDDFLGFAWGKMKFDKCINTCQDKMDWGLWVL